MSLTLLAFATLALPQEVLAVKDERSTAHLLQLPCPVKLLPLARRGNNYMQEEQFEQAAEVYSQAIKQAPDIVLFYQCRADAYELMKKPALALVDWNKIVALKPRTSTSYLYRGRIYDNLGRDQEALADYNRAIAHGCQTAYKDLARVYEKQGKYDLCIHNLSLYLNTVQQLERIPFLNDRARIYQKMGKAALAEADRKSAAKLLSQSGGQNIEKYPDLVRSKNK